MIENLHKGEFGLEGTCKFNLFDCEIDIYIEKDVSIEYAEKCVKMLNTLSDNTIDDLCKYSIRYFEDFKNNYDEDEFVEWCNMPTHVEGREILKYIYPSGINIEYPENHNIYALDMELNCEWEEEHGMEWVIRDNKVIYVSSYNGVGAWVDDDCDCCNYVLNESTI